MVNDFLFGVFPYLAVLFAVIFGIYRYKVSPFSYSSLSSQFLENRTLFWGSVPWHYGILIILLAHIFAAVFPGVWGALIASPARLHLFEITGLILALYTVLGLFLITARRLFHAKVSAVTSFPDWLLLISLFIQVVFGFFVALFYRWGSDWYLFTVVPWLGSLCSLHPQIQYVTGLPWVVQFHILWGFFIILLFPFTRLVHLVTFPIGYLWRPYQVVIWNRRSSRQLE